MSRAIEITKDLIKMKSVTPNDAGCQKYIASILTKLGFEVEHLPFEDVSNIWAVYTFSEDGPLLCFAGHTDVVHTGDQSLWDEPPFSANESDGYLYGRGAADMKGGIGAALAAIEDIINSAVKLEGKIAFLITSDEEGIAINGTKKVIEYLNSKSVKIDLCVVGEPSSTNTVGDTIKNGRRGSLNATLTINGKQGHVAYPDLADNVLHKSFAFLNELSEIELDNGYENFLASNLEITSTRVDNEATNVIPGIAKINFNIRYNPKQTKDGLISIIEKLIDKHHLKNSTQIEWQHSGKPFYCDNKDFCSYAVDAVKDIKGFEPKLSTAGGTSDGRFIAPTGAAVIELGLINATIHQINERVKLTEINELSQIYKKLFTKALLLK